MENRTLQPPYPAHPSSSTASAAREDRPLSRAARAFDLYIKVTLLSAAGAFVTGAAAAIHVPVLMTAPIGALLIVAGTHPVIIASYLALCITSDPSHWIGDASPGCHALLWLILAPYLGSMLFEAGRRFMQSGPAAPVLYPLCVASFTVTSLLFATHAQTS